MTSSLALTLAFCLSQTQAPAPRTVEMQVFTEEADENGGDGYSPSPEAAHETLRFTGYLDVGYAVARGNGSSFAPGDTRLPADYTVDAFAPAINSRGEVASIDSGGRFMNGFLPRSAGLGSTPSFLINTLSADLRFTPSEVPLMFFARAQFMPRFSSSGDATRVLLQQAFAKWNPISTQEFSVALGRFDSVFGIEYLENEANLRLNITPSLIARYTTGHSLGLKGFYRVQLPSLWSAVSLNVAATNNGTRVEELAGPSLSFSGVPVGSARLGYELNLQAVQMKLGVSGLYGPRSDQKSWDVRQMALGLDFRLNAFGVAVAAELLRLVDEPGKAAGKFTGLGSYELATGFAVWGGYVLLGYALPFEYGHFNRLTFYGRYERRHAQFKGFTPIAVDRLTVGGRVDLFDRVALKAEWLVNREVAGAPYVDNNVFTSSAVFTW